MGTVVKGESWFLAGHASACGGSGHEDRGVLESENDISRGESPALRHDGCICLQCRSCLPATGELQNCLGVNPKPYSNPHAIPHSRCAHAHDKKTQALATEIADSEAVDVIIAGLGTLLQRGFSGLCPYEGPKGMGLYLYVRTRAFNH